MGGGSSAAMERGTGPACERRTLHIIVPCLMALGLGTSSSVLAAWPAPATGTCDAACQAAQRTALTLLYTSTGASNWTRPASYSDGIAVPITQWGFAVPLPLPLPIHCYWAGVFCCDPGGYISLATGYSYVSSGNIPCDTAYGVTSLMLVRNNIVGQIPDSVWPPLAVSLTRLDLASKFQAWQFAAPGAPLAR